jgi:excisionase family DNA binding protein
MKNNLDNITNERPENKIHVPINQKLLLSIREAAEYSGIGINKINDMLRSPGCPYVLYVGVKKLVKREAFEEFLKNQLII